MKKIFDRKNKGASLVSIILIGLIVVFVIYLVILIFKKGLIVLSKAETSKAETLEAQVSEQANLILNSYKTESYTSSGKGFEEVLSESKQKSEVMDYWYSDEVSLVKINNRYAIIKLQGDNYVYVGSVELDGDEYAQKSIENYKKSILKDSKEQIEFEDKNLYIISKKIRSNCYTYNIPSSSEVTVAIIDKVEINNKDRVGAAINIEKNGLLNLYVFNDVTVSSLYNGNSEIKYNAITPDGGFAGICVPENAKLNIYGNSNLFAYGGPAGKGGTYDSDDLTAGSGGGGAGAGIGGNGGQGGDAKEKHSSSGKNGGSCGEIDIHGRVSVFAYGGAGADGGDAVRLVGEDPDNIKIGAGAGGGYPASGIGGGRSRRRWRYYASRCWRIFWRCRNTN